MEYWCVVTREESEWNWDLIENLLQASFELGR